MIDSQAFAHRFFLAAYWVKPSMEFLWLAAVVTVPLTFASSSLMGDGYSVPMVTLYRSLVGLMRPCWPFSVEIEAPSAP